MKLFNKMLKKFKEDAEANYVMWNLILIIVAIIPNATDFVIFHNLVLFVLYLVFFYFVPIITLGGFFVVATLNKLVKAPSTLSEILEFYISLILLSFQSIKFGIFEYLRTMGIVYTGSIILSFIFITVKERRKILLTLTILPLTFNLCYGIYKLYLKSNKSWVTLFFIIVSIIWYSYPVHKYIKKIVGEKP